MDASRATKLHNENLMGRKIWVGIKKSISRGGHEENTDERDQRSVFISHLKSDNQEVLKELFRDCGEIVAIRHVYEKESGKFRGSCFVEFKRSKSQKKALELHGSKVEEQGVLIRTVRPKNLREKLR